MKRILLCLSMVLAAAGLSAQRNTNTELNMNNLYSGEALDVFDLRSRTVEGSLYFSEDWMVGSALLKNGAAVNNIPARYNLVTQDLELQYEGQVFVLPGSMIAQFTLQSWPEGERITFFSASNYLEGADFDRLFLRMLSEGTLTLLLSHDVEVLKPNYVPALDAGNINPKAVQKERYFLYKDSNLEEIPKRRKKAREFFEERCPGAARFIRAEKIRFKTSEDYRRVVEFCNR